MSTSLIYQISSMGQCFLEPQNALNLDRRIWQALVDQLSVERSLGKVSADALQSRYQSGYSAIIIHDETIISHLSVIPTNIQQILIAYTGNQINSPFPEIWKSVTGWTHPRWRGKGLSQYLRQEIYQKYDSQLILGTTFGKGASSQLDNLGWSLADWDRIPFISSLDAWCKPNSIYKVGVGWQRHDGKFPYKPNQCHSSHHSMDNYFHLWVNNIDLALELESSVIQVVGEDLSAWRKWLETT